MSTVPAEEINKISYINPLVVADRCLLMMPLWDGCDWHMWIEAPTGLITKIQVVDTIHSNYFAKQPAHMSDIRIEFVEYMWQRANWPDVGRLTLSIQDDFHLLATSVAKLSYFFDTRDRIAPNLISSFVQTELEYLITVARSVFDLLQEALAAIWNNRVNLLDLTQDAIKKRHKLPETFTKIAIQGRETARSIEQLTKQYAIPPALAEQYHRIAAFYISLLKARDKIIHGGGSVEAIFVTEKGFCVHRNAKTFADFNWKPEHSYNENLVSLLPWVANIVFGTIRACDQIISAFSSAILMPPEIAPGYNVFIRDPANGALGHLANANNGDLIWWSDAISSRR